MPEDFTKQEKEHMEKLMSEAKAQLGLGSTGQFPEGKIHPTDEGELRLAIGHKDGKVFISFGEPTEWIGLKRDQAIQMAKVIIEHAMQAE